MVDINQNKLQQTQKLEFKMTYCPPAVCHIQEPRGEPGRLAQKTGTHKQTLIQQHHPVDVEGAKVQQKKVLSL